MSRKAFKTLAKEFKHYHNFSNPKKQRKIKLKLRSIYSIFLKFISGFRDSSCSNNSVCEYEKG